MSLNRSNGFNGTTAISKLLGWLSVSFDDVFENGKWKKRKCWKIFGLFRKHRNTIVFNGGHKQAEKQIYSQNYCIFCHIFICDLFDIFLRKRRRESKNTISETFHWIKSYFMRTRIPKRTLTVGMEFMPWLEIVHTIVMTESHKLMKCIVYLFSSLFPTGKWFIHINDRQLLILTDKTAQDTNKFECHHMEWASFRL